MTKNFKLLLEEARKIGLSTNIVYPEKEVVGNIGMILEK